MRIKTGGATVNNYARTNDRTLHTGGYGLHRYMPLFSEDGLGPEDKEAQFKNQCLVIPESEDVQTAKTPFID